MRRFLLMLALLGAPVLRAQQATGPTASAFGTVTAPAAAASIDSSGTAGLSGIYRVTAQCFFSAGAPAAADLNNVQLQLGATVVGRIVMPIALNTLGPVVTFERLQPSSQIIRLVAPGTGTAAVVYNCLLTWTPVS